MLLGGWLHKMYQRGGCVEDTQSGTGGADVSFSWLNY